MSLGAIGAALAVLVAVFIVGHIWFHIVEGVLNGLQAALRKKWAGRVAYTPAGTGKGGK